MLQLNSYQEYSLFGILALILLFVAVPYCYVVYAVFLDWLEAMFGPVVRQLRELPRQAVVRPRIQRRYNMARIRGLSQ